METLLDLSNGELATKMYEVTKRYGELSLWISEAELKITTMIMTNNEVQSEIAQQVKLKHAAEIEKYMALSNLKKIELEMDRRVQGVICGAV